MPSSRIIGAVTLTVLLVGAGFAGPLGSVSAVADQQERTTESTIRVSATGQVEADPDRAILRVAAVATADSANVARERLAENVSSMRASLSEANVSDDQIRTVAYDIFQEEDRDPETGERVSGPYRATQAFEITVTDVDRIGPVIDAAVDGGANRVDDIQLTLSEETSRQLRAEALTEAMANARSDADTVANASDLTIVNVHSVDTADFGFEPRRTDVVTEAAADAGGTQIDSGPVTVTASVTVVYNATAD